MNGHSAGCMRKRRRIVFLIAFLALVAGAVTALQTDLLPARLNPLAPLDPGETPGLLTGFKLWRSGNDLPACKAALRQAGVSVNAPAPKVGARPGCALEDAVALARLSAASLGEPEEMRCDVALRLYMLERHFIQPAARRHLRSRVERIAHFGSYSCRTIADSSRLSEHATANAFDIAGFHLEDGRLITLKRHWTAGGEPARFLRAVREGACDVFNMVLSPDYNAAHADHFHVDMGLFRGCN
jgi:hypothetical protein